jgi:hypothetical protein
MSRTVDGVLIIERSEDWLSSACQTFVASAELALNSKHKPSFLVQDSVFTRWQSPSPFTKYLLSVYEPSSVTPTSEAASSEAW